MAVATLAARIEEPDPESCPEGTEAGAGRFFRASLRVDKRSHSARG